MGVVTLLREKIGEILTQYQFHVKVFQHPGNEGMRYGNKGVRYGNGGIGTCRSVSYSTKRGK